MNKKKTLIDSVYINTGGGKKILIQLIKYFIALDSLDEYYFLLDARFDINEISILMKDNYTKIIATEKNRKAFYFNNLKGISSVICMSNVPPPFKLETPVYIYFHNDLLLTPLTTNLSYRNRIINLIKKTYIRYLSKAQYNWIVQTPLMKLKLNKYLKIYSNQIKIAPIFELNKIKRNDKKKNQFLYVSSFSNHKNHKRLFQAFIHVAKKIKFDIQLNLTIPENIFKQSFYSTKNIPNNLKIINHGSLGNKDLGDLYNFSEYLIFPSLNESFGLPLVESIAHQCKVIAAKLDYVKEVIEPSLYFDPYSYHNISDTIFFALTNNVKESKIKVENKIGTFVKYIQKNV
jgi:glycosyltransferase involved in cell wall biosynthesis